MNYFGKTDLGCTGVGKVTIYPVFIRKVYPLGVLYSMKCQQNSVITYKSLMNGLFYFRVKLILPYMDLATLRMGDSRECYMYFTK